MAEMSSLLSMRMLGSVSRRGLDKRQLRAGQPRVLFAKRFFGTLLDNPFMPCYNKTKKQ
jgi:hypothetical protein